MKPDKKKELITTEEYQRPPLLEEIKKFKEELKLVSSFILFSAGVVAIIAFWNKVAFLLENISLFVWKRLELDPRSNCDPKPIFRSSHS